MGFAHQIITPLWQIYGQMEILMVYATVRQLVKTSHAEIRNWRQDIFSISTKFSSNDQLKDKCHGCKNLNRKEHKANPSEQRNKQTNIRKR